ncbi:cyclic nucleotide-binding-like protein [Phlyctochytrium arcticum]|nr:cyclic nucleotide-binding-like protein [Phlyctochytrium arcticum]
MFFLASGEVDVIGEYGDLIDTAKGPDAWFGEVGLLQDVPRTASVRAKTVCSTFSLRKDDFMASLKAHPSIASRIEETARERLQAHLMRSILA